MFVAIRGSRFAGSCGVYGYSAQIKLCAFRLEPEGCPKRFLSHDSYSLPPEGGSHALKVICGFRLEPEGCGKRSYLLDSHNLPPQGGSHTVSDLWLPA
jgi:hypothetical protein